LNDVRSIILKLFELKAILHLNSFFFQSNILFCFLFDVLKTFNESSKLLFADVNSNDNLSVEKLKNFESLCILIGPEGDFSPSERQFILSFSQVVPFTISKNILRSDTAVISAISLVNFINNYP